MNFQNPTPEEIAALLNWVRETHAGRLVVVFQPHRHTRTRQYSREFRDALAVVGLASLDLERMAGSLSLANRQLIGVARSLMRPWRLLILDDVDAWYKKVWAEALALAHSSIDAATAVVSSEGSGSGSGSVGTGGRDVFSALTAEYTYGRDGAIAEIAGEILQQQINSALAKATCADFNRGGVIMAKNFTPKIYTETEPTK